jgi:hypothetical protein
MKIIYHFRTASNDQDDLYQRLKLAFCLVIIFQNGCDPVDQRNPGRFEILTAMTHQILVSWGVMLYNLVSR